MKAAIIYVASNAERCSCFPGSFREQTRRYAGALGALGIGAGDLVVIASTQSLESIYAFWGALRVGAMPSMFPTLTEKLDPAIYMGSMAELVALSGVRAVLTTDEFAPQLGRHMSAVPCMARASWRWGRLAEVSAEAPDPEETAFLQHSSGTTGLQKGVALSHTAVLNQIASYSTAIELGESDVVVSWLPLYHDMGLIAGFLLPLLQGIPLVLMSPVRLGAVIRRCCCQRIDAIKAPLPGCQTSPITI